MQSPPLSLYIHIPWCERKCPYCDFNSHEANVFPEQQYIAALLRDLRQDLPMGQGRTIESLFIGGGTPSLFSVESISRLLRGIADLVPLAPDLEATMEANPGSVKADKFMGFRSAGINRLSLGIQSFNDDHLQALGRIHSSEQAHAAIEHTRSAGFDNFNIDLMHGLPGQTPAIAASDLRAALEHQPSHLSWYQLTIEPNTAFYKRPPLLPVEEELADIQQQGETILAESGYKQYEVSAYSKPGRNCRHNRNYWSFGDYLGIGAGAHGKITFPDGRIQRYSKTRQPKDYLVAELTAFTSARRELDSLEIPGEFVLNALRLNDGFSLQQFTNNTGLPWRALEPQLALLCERRLLCVTDGRVEATALGRRFLDSVVTEFFPG